jgi:hypothetical protein
VQGLYCYDKASGEARWNEDVVPRPSIGFDAKRMTGRIREGEKRDIYSTYRGYVHKLKIS